MSDYYDILGVSKKATASEIKAAYRKQALKWHPDRNKSPEATNKFKEVNKLLRFCQIPKKESFMINTEKRLLLMPAPEWSKRWRKLWPLYLYLYEFWGFTFEGMDFGGFSDPFEIFEQFFGFQSPFSGRHRASRRDVYQIKLSFDEAVHGTKKETVINGEQKAIKIPAGVDNGRGFDFSDFDLQVAVRPHPFFKREGQDILLEKEISYPLAVLGGVIEVPTVHGQIKLKVRPGTKAERPFV
jgi:DnaJ-class molecular chaperone